MAAELLGRRVVERVTVVAPTEHLKTQWAEAAARAGIPIDPTYSAGKGRSRSDFLGVAVTYAGVAVNPLAMRVRTERFQTLVILDEVHHAGDARSWGEAVREAFEPGARRLALTGTPFRSDMNPIPFVTYAPGETGSRARSPTTPTATRTRWPTASSGRCCSSPTPARCAGAPGPATRWPPGWASRSPRTSPTRRCAPRWTRTAPGSRRCCGPRTGGSPRCASTCRTPAGW